VPRRNAFRAASQGGRSVRHAIIVARRIVEALKGLSKAAPNGAGNLPELMVEAMRSRQGHGTVAAGKTSLHTILRHNYHKHRRHARAALHRKHWSRESGRVSFTAPCP
jgi:hypothetical protein